MSKKIDKERPRLVILAPHIVQYHAPLYQEIASAQQVDLTVLYCADYGYRPFYDPTLKTTLQWNNRLLTGYHYNILRNFSVFPNKPIIGRVNPGIVNLLFKGNFDVILIQDYYYLTSWIALFLAKLLKMKVVIRGEGNIKSGVKESSHNLRDIATRKFITSADHVLYSCTGNREWLISLGADPKKMSLIPCSVDNVFFKNKLNQLHDETKTPKAQLGLREDILYVISVARMHSRKRLIDLVEAVAIVQKEGGKLGIILVGEGPAHQLIESRIYDLGVKEAHIFGFVDNDEISRYYASADMFVLTSDYDPSPKALSEALIFSLPVVCSNTIGTYRDLVIDGYNGFSFQPGDIRMLADHLLRIVKDDELRLTMGKNSLAISNAWSLEAAAKSVIKATKDLCEKPGK